MTRSRISKPAPVRLVAAGGRGTGAARTYQTLRNRILSLELAPGSDLDEASLVELLGVSRTPVREALIRLAADDLVVLLPNRGAKVAPLDLMDLPRYIEALDLAQRAVNRFAARRRTERDLANIRAANQAFEAATDRGDAMELTELNHEFHAAIARAAHNRFVADHYVHLLDQGMRLLRIPFAFDAAEDRANLHILRIAGEHMDMLQAIENRDADLADRQGHAHAELFRSRLMKFLRQNLAPGLEIDP